ncbi:uncharacterized protein N7479_001340 [Penicillium vulpinum]|uniref:uncharacterized protein n=1 Tax=Penicillium vulpinum TaxID=29845 RepID=UPI00254914CB|nr:uncharacterized protein N7479_001340 [Penicillium vulpinum]KAJ5971422.1 hypothetical protein N7479_001340 [Penicillium vulpinum]
MAWLFWEFRRNYVWLINRIFIPTLLNALAGFLTTIVSLYTAYDGDWSIMVLLTVITSDLSVACSLILLYIYKFGKLQRLKREHNQMFRNYEHPPHVQELPTLYTMLLQRNGILDILKATVILAVLN